MFTHVGETLGNHMLAVGPRLYISEGTGEKFVVLSAAAYEQLSGEKADGLPRVGNLNDLANVDSPADTRHTKESALGGPEGSRGVHLSRMQLEDEVPVEDLPL